MGGFCVIVLRKEITENLIFLICIFDLYFWNFLAFVSISMLVNRIILRIWLKLLINVAARMLFIDRRENVATFINFHWKELPGFEGG